MKSVPSHFLEPVNAYLEGLVHPLAREDRRMLLSQRNFIAARLFAGIAAIAILPVHLALFGAPSALEIIGYAWFTFPLVLVWQLSRNGNFERAHILSALIFAAIIGIIAAMTGGGSSFILPWLIVIPFEPALHASRRTALAATGIAAFTAAVIALASVFNLLPAPLPFPVVMVDPHLFSVLSATLYMGMIALGAGGREVSDPIANERNRVIAENIGEVVTCHGRNGAVSFVSPAAEKLLNVPASELMSHAFFERVHIADRPVFLTAIAETASKGKPSAIEYRLRRGPQADGVHAVAPTYIWVETRYRAQGQQVIGVTSDISRRKSDELALEAAQIEAMRANETKSRFLATVSHELRTPLNAIIGFSEMLTREPLAGDDRREDYARLIRESGEHLLSVVNGILDVAQIDTGHFTISPMGFSAAELIESCREMMALRAEQAGISLAVSLAPDLPELVADERAVRQIAINLLSNAIKFTERGGTIAVNARIENGSFALTVADSGIGISESDLKQIGNPFFQAAS
ncbi:MAG TPA: histidine kinase dimerization/phospho-acceptor domain-containing protein, partial [Xanthobacteraceae bacterium]|nr:histidine kinase dimerization/phospho-acceptor domain-containing protein [Xanthobacteraceae bacterium]